MAINKAQTRQIEVLWKKTLLDCCIIIYCYYYYYYISDFGVVVVFLSFFFLVQFKIGIFDARKIQCYYYYHYYYYYSLFNLLLGASNLLCSFHLLLFLPPSLRHCAAARLTNVSCVWIPNHAIYIIWKHKRIRVSIYVYIIYTTIDHNDLWNYYFNIIIIY